MLTRYGLSLRNATNNDYSTKEMKPNLDNNKHREIDDLIGNLSGEESRVFYDGAIDLNRYNLASQRILWILKEAVEDYGADRYNNQLIDDNMNYRTFCPTLEVVAYASYGILRRKSLWSDIPYIYDDDGPAEALREIAIINVSKAMGESISPDSRILSAYQENKELIKKQLDFYDPEIVILGFPEACSQIVQDIIAQDGSIQGSGRVGDCAYFVTPTRKFIWHYHPAQRGSREIYTEEILSAANAK